MSAHSQPVTILQFLRACPQLEHFSLTGWIHDDIHFMNNAKFVSLPRLKTLTLTNTCTTRAILSHIYTPRLEEVCLGHLNVDWALPRDGEPFDGESDDEANDFSRSPSSDLATGMGLRALIRRSKPPIKVLRMDFADMRTKDFHYVFDHLSTLEIFYIVASDMSNNVMRLFKPLAGRIRLPRLHTLELHNCIRLSGDTIVDCLSERVSLTDGTDFTLQRVTISGCDQYEYWHAQSLRNRLGSRLTN